jgi:hypothetical protein
VRVNLLKELARALVVSDLGKLEAIGGRASDAVLSVPCSRKWLYTPNGIRAVARASKLLVCGLDDLDDRVPVLSSLRGKRREGFSVIPGSTPKQPERELTGAPSVTEMIKTGF